MWARVEPLAGFGACVKPLAGFLGVLGDNEKHFLDYLSQVMGGKRTLRPSKWFRLDFTLYAHVTAKQFGGRCSLIAPSL